jgi:hypothetical protein
MLAQGVDARTIMERWGHSQISLTLDTWASTWASDGSRGTMRRSPLGVLLEKVG